MGRAVLMAVATMSLLGVNALADNFTFSFTDPAVGTVTGEIFGLQNNATGKATEVLITSYPASLGSIKDLIATDWDTPVFNSFTETNGAITGANFEAINAGDSITPLLDLSENSSLITDNGIVRGAQLPLPPPLYPSHSRGFYYSRLCWQ